MSHYQSNNPEVLIFAPLPPEPNGIADYVAEQLVYFARRYNVTVVISDTAPTPLPQPAVRIIRLHAYLAQREQWALVPHVYHVGNNTGHGWLLPVLLRQPGILVQHDGKLNYVYYSITGTLENCISSQVAFSHYGGPARDLSLWDSMSLSCAHLLAQQSLRIIVHSKHLASFHQVAFPSERVAIIPLHVDPHVEKLYPNMQVSSRHQFNIPDNAFLLVSPGFATRNKGIAEVLTNLSTLKRTIPHLHYLLAGAASDEIRDLISVHGLQHHVTITGFLDEAAFYSALIAADIVLALRTRYEGESSAVLARALGLGRACIVNDIGAYAEIPDHVVYKIPFRHCESALGQAIAKLAADADVRAKLEHAARDYAETTLHIEATTAAYAEVIEAVRGDLAATPPVKTDYTLFARHVDFHTPQAFAKRLAQLDEGLLHQLNSQEPHTLWWHNNMLPLAGEQSLAVWGANPHDLRMAQELFNHVHAETIDPPAQQGESHSLLLALLSLDDVLCDPLRYFGECNRLVQPGGLCIINVLSHTASQFSLSDWHDVARAAGFNVLTYADALAGGGMLLPSAITDHLSAQKPRVEVALCLHKVSSMIDRYPPRYYNTVFPVPQNLDAQTPSLFAETVNDALPFASPEEKP